MSEFQLISICFWILSLIGTVVALIRSTQSLKLGQAQVEVNVRNQIKDSMRRVEDFIDENADFLERDEAGLTDQEKKKRARLVAGAHSRIEGYLSALDGACGKYLDNKIDRERFKKDYQREIRQAVQDKSHAEYFRTGHAYNALMAVYEEWENPEKKV